ncbi:MAG TPA: arsenate reductase (azurin) small subunit [Methylomirabilota bacterium]|nr:arsenate reductase (azurin) small subunit [Methylomirabilota bacterium]
MKCDKLVDVGRRKFLRGGAFGAAGVAAASVLPAGQAQAQALARVDYPSNRLANVADLTVNEAMDIAYPDADSPGVLLKLGTPVEGGAGPDGDIVAFSVLCPHKGWQLTYNADDKTLNCPGHFSRFDCEAGGQQTWGHATQNLPQFTLRIDGAGDIFAEGVDELVYGRLSNVLPTA